MDTPLTNAIEAFRAELGPVDRDVSWRDLLNHARQMERERNKWAERWADLDRAGVSDSVALEKATNLLRLVLNGGIDAGIEWQQVMDKVRDFLKSNVEGQPRRE